MGCRGLNPAKTLANQAPILLHYSSGPLISLFLRNLHTFFQGDCNHFYCYWVCTFECLHILANTCYFRSFWHTFSWVRIQRSLCVFFLICMAIPVRNTEHFVMFLWSISTSSLEKCLVSFLGIVLLAFLACCWLTCILYTFCIVAIWYCIYHLLVASCLC